MTYLFPLNWLTFCLLAVGTSVIALSACADPPKFQVQNSTIETYANPVISTPLMADPDVLNIEGRYYLYATSHNQGYDVYVSTDLVHWENQGARI